MAETVEINPEILKWARASAGLSSRDAARKIGETEERLERLERGEIGPSPSLLERIAAAYRRPLIAFYLTSPPRTARPVGDFRTLAAPRPEEERALLDALVRDVRARQSIVRDLLEDDEDRRDLPFVACSEMGDGVEGVVDDVRKVLGVTHGDQQGANNADVLFKMLRGRAESAGVFVLLAGDLGSPQHNAISVETFRGYALVDKIAPFIVINDRDAKVARSFTLIHELAHICLGEEGISGPAEPEIERHLPPIEVFCNRVASEFLLPESALPRVEVTRSSDQEYINELVDKVARNWNVSRPTVLYRFYKARFIKQAIWNSLRTRYISDLEKKLEQERENKSQKEGGTNYYVVKRDRLGNGLLNLARQMISDGALSYTKAAKLLAVKVSNISPLLNDGR